MSIRRTSLTHFDAVLDTDVCDRYNNAELTLILRVHLQQRNPTGATGRGTFPDYGDPTETQRQIIRWDANSWATWRRRYESTGQAFWNGKFWLLTPPNLPSVVAGAGYTAMDYTDRAVIYRPNVYCKFDLRLQDTAAGAHTTIDVVRLAQSETWFGSHAQLYDSHDLAPRDTGGGRLQRAHVHEIGHLLGLGHSAEHRQACQATGDTNSQICYGTTPEESDEVMGSGMALSPLHAMPWMQAMRAFSGLSEMMWPPMMQRHYPRSPDDIANGRYPTVRPNRG